MGDGVLAYFGYPRADEDDAERAVCAGLTLVAAVEGLDVGPEARLRVRVGIATGLVIVGDLLGDGASQEHGVVGETPNLASRLQALAEPDTVVIDGSTRRLVGGLFEYLPLGSVSITGFSDPVPVWRVIGANAVDSRFEASRLARTPLLGRDEEIELLMRRWQQIKRGDGSVVLISGEPGIGKSRLAETVLERLSDDPHIRLRRFCSPHHQDSALFPTISQLERAAGFRRDDTDRQRLDKLEALLAEANADLSEAVPLIADLLSVPIGNRYPPLSLTPQKRKEKTLGVLLAQLEGLAARRPVLMVFEDVHWIDPTSLDLLDRIVDRVATLRVLLIITFRPEFAPAWIGRSHVTLISLSRLPHRQRAEMIMRVTGGKALPQEIAERIIKQYEREVVDGVYLVFNEFKSVIAQRVIVQRILPVQEIGRREVTQVEELSVETRERMGEAAKSAGISLKTPQESEIDREAVSFATAPVDYIYEQPPAELLNAILPRYVAIQIYASLLESVAAEHAARMTAMDSATNNANEVIDSLTLNLNRVRQAAITKEIIEIVSGAAAL